MLLSGKVFVARIVGCGCNSHRGHNFFFSSPRVFCLFVRSFFFLLTRTLVSKIVPKGGVCLNDSYVKKII